MKLINKLRLSNYTNDNWLTFFRISIAFFSILLMMSIWKDISNIFLEEAIIKPDILDISMDRFSPTIIDLYQFLHIDNLNIEYNNFVYIIITTYLFFLVALMVGFVTRFSALMSLLLQIVIIKSMHYYLYGVDYFQTMALFYCFIFPIRKYSLDELLFKKVESSQISKKWSLILLQFHLCIIYFFSGFDKGIGINWYNGESVWRAVSGHNNNGLINLVDLNISGNVYMVIGILTLIVEFFYPLFINIKQTRLLWVTLTIGMHLSIIIFMGLYFFGTIMIILNLAAYYFPYERKTKTEIKIEKNLLTT